MIKDIDIKTTDKKTEETEKKGIIRRRDILKGLAAVPVFGAFFYSLYKKNLLDDLKRKEILNELGIIGKRPAVLPDSTMKKPGELIRLGIIGFGGRGEYLANRRCYRFCGSGDKQQSEIV